jgi:uncharacterized protein YqeY
MVKQKLMDDLVASMKRRDKLRTGCLRMLRSKVLEREVALRPKKGADYELEDEEALQVISTYAKQRKDSIKSYRQGNREDLAAKEEAELKIIEEYLPTQMSAEELRPIVDEAIAESGATSPKDMGQVMKLVMARVQGSADGKVVNQIVREKLAG